jgi:glycosyltransferase involved in cell wall biosynthesis
VAKPFVIAIAAAAPISENAGQRDPRRNDQRACGISDRSPHDVNLGRHAIMTTSCCDLSVVLPACDEAANIAPMCAALGKVLVPLGTAEIIFVDDGSRDDTLGELRAAAGQNPSLRYISFTRNFGHQAALRAGLHHARGRAVILMDADFEHPPELIPKLVAAWHAGAKVVVTKRDDEDSRLSALKSVTSRLFYRALDTIGDVRIDPGSSDFMLLDRAVVDRIRAIEDRGIFLRGLVRWLGYPMTTVAFSRGRRRSGNTKFTLPRMIELAVTGLSAHSLRPLRFAVWLSLVFAAFGGVLLAYSIVSFVFIQRTVVGWSSIMGAIAILAAAQFLVLGIIGEYVGRILLQTGRRPSYVIAETDEDRGAK